MLGPIICTRTCAEPFYRWRNSVDARFERLEHNIQRLLRNQDLPIHGAETLVGGSPDVTSDPDDSSPLHGREAVTEPMQSIVDVTSATRAVSSPTVLPDNGHDDLIRSGVLSLNMAEALFTFFSERMNQYLWGGIALVHDDLAATRRSSVLLSTAVLTVASMHLSGKEDLFDRCCARFSSLVAKTMVVSTHTLDTIRALIIGAFWLYDWSWKLSGLAVRIATELNLHHAYQQLMRGDTAAFERTRLWYLLYVCDHHFSIAYGRPPMTYTSPAIRGHKAVLNMPQAGPQDYRIISQVEIFHCLNDAYDTFGVETPSPLQDSDVGKLQEFGLRIESWRVQWQGLLGMQYPSLSTITAELTQLETLTLVHIPARAWFFIITLPNCNCIALPFAV
jgi:hypothetical protein